MFKTNSLTTEVKKIILDAGTEYCSSGIYNDFGAEGTYLCRNCGLGLFDSKDKFHSGSGWPSFDREIAGAIEKVSDKDRVRTELLCSRCRGHLGHIFYGEGYTPLNTRYCINSLALDFIPKQGIIDTEEAIVAAGCFWGVEYLFSKAVGVVKTEVGYIGGSTDNPTYESVCRGNTAHQEAVRIVYDPQVISYLQIIKHFFEIHDFAQSDGQGGDIGEQYLSKIFYFSENQRLIAANLIKELRVKNYTVATIVEPVKTFWAAEDYHQEYYNKRGGKPYCHIWKKIF